MPQKGQHMRFATYAVLTIVALLVATAGLVYATLPTTYARNEIAARVLERTGRALTVAGPVSLKFYPQTAVEFDDVTISPPPGMDGEPTLKVHALQLDVPLWPLFQHKLLVQRIGLDRPVLVLRTDADGRRSWDFRKQAVAAAPHLRGPEAVAPVATAAPVVPAPATAAPVLARNLAGLEKLQLRDITVNGGTIRLIDERTGLDETLTDVALDLGLASIEDSARLKGAVTWSGEATAIEGSLGPVANLVTGDPARLELAASGRLAKASVKGTLAQQDATPLSGSLQLEAGSLRDLLTWLGKPLPAGPGFGAVKLAGDFGLSAGGFSASNANLSLDGATATGAFAISRGTDKPFVRADLAIDRLDLNTYLGSAATAATKPASTAAAATPSKATAADTGWSTEPIDLSALRKADAEATLTVGGLQWHAIKLGKTVLKVNLKGGLMKSRLGEITVYDGKGQGTVTLDASGQECRVETNFTLHAIDMQPFLIDTAGFNRIAGRGDLAFSFQGTGRSQLDIVKSLAGQGHMELADGSIAGFNLSGGLKALEHAALGGSGGGAQLAGKTDFASLSATATVTGGVLDSRDLLATANFLRLTGAGTADLPTRTLDYELHASFAGDQAAAAAGAPPPTFSVPVRVKGPWSKPSVGVDLRGLAKSPQAAIDTVKKAVDSFAASKQGKAVGAFIGGLLHKGAKPAAAAPPESEPPADAAPAPAQ